MSEPDDAQLMHRVAQQDQAAFSMLMQRHLSGLRGYLLRLCNNPSDADDLVQESFLKLWRNAQHYDPSQGAVATWLYRIGHNGFIDFARRLTPADAHHSDNTEELASDNAALGQQSDAQQALQQLNRHLGQLPLNQRSAMVLRFLHGRSSVEVAAILGISASAVDSLVARARRQLQALLGAEEQENQGA